MAVWAWMMLGSEIWIRDECQVNILLLSAMTGIHSWIGARKETWKPFPSSFVSHQPKPRTHLLDYHRSSFLFCFSPLVPIQSIFISTPLSFLYSAFHFNPISQSFPQPLFHSLFSSSATCSVSLPPPVCHPVAFSFNLPLRLRSLQIIFLIYWHISCFSFLFDPLALALFCNLSP